MCIIFIAENAIENMIGPDWKKRWLYWKNRTQEQVIAKLWFPNDADWFLLGQALDHSLCLTLDKP